MMYNRLVPDNDSSRQLSTGTCILLTIILALIKGLIMARVCQWQRVTVGCLQMICALAVATLSTSVSAHEIRPSIAELFVSASGQVELNITTNLEALISQIGAEHDDTDASPQADAYNALRQLAPADLERAFGDFQPQLLSGVSLHADAQPLTLSVSAVDVSPIGDIELPRTSRLLLTGQMPLGASTTRFSWKADFGASVLRVRGLDDDITFTQFLRNGDRSDSIAIARRAPQTFLQRFSHFVWVGFTHIVPKGLDHILFVVGLFLLSMRLGALLWQITLFTVAHSITLALAMLGVVSVPASIVEPAIAASIVYVCVENLLTDSLSRWRLLVVFLFGLLHGLGFASVLTDIGLKSSEFVTGLIAFNIGVEAGQIGVVIACMVTFGLLRKRPWYRQSITRPASALVGLIGVWWFVQRVFLETG